MIRSGTLEASAVTGSGGTVAILRVPIVDRAGTVHGYALRFDDRDPQRDPARSAQATSALLCDVLGDVGLDELVGTRQAWLPVAHDFLRDVHPPPLRSDRAVLQIVAEPAREDLLAVLRRLSETGYMVALDGYDGHPALDALLAVCRIVVIDCASLSFDAVAAAAERAAAFGALLVARGVHDSDAFARCAAMGFERFAGQVLGAAQRLRLRPVGGGHSAASLASIAALAEAGHDFEALERVIGRDVALALALLRYVNSAFFALPRTVSSVREALILLGARMVSRWATVVALAGASSAPSDLVALALQRARMCERLAAGGPVDEQRESLFTVGLFSVADALLGVPMEKVLESLPFSAEIQAALLRHEGPKGHVLASVLAYERGDFAALDGADPHLYVEALAYGDELARAGRERG